MPKVINFADPDTATKVGASISIARIGPGNAGVQVSHNPNNGDDAITYPLTDLSAAAQTALGTLVTAMDAAYKAKRAYT